MTTTITPFPATVPPNLTGHVKAIFFGAEDHIIHVERIPLDTVFTRKCGNETSVGLLREAEIIDILADSLPARIEERKALHAIVFSSVGVPVWFEKAEAEQGITLTPTVGYPSTWPV